MRRTALLLALLITTALAAITRPGPDTRPTPPRVDPVKTLGTVPIDTPHRAWQGVAYDPNRNLLIVVSDRNQDFELQSIITVLTTDGTLLAEHLDAHSVTDSQGRFMSFGDAAVIDGVLYTPVYNINAGGPAPYESKVLEWAIDELDRGPRAVHDIGAGVAEGVAAHDGHFWTVYHDQRIVRQWDSTWNLVATHALSGAPPNAGGWGEYQTIEWRGDSIYVNLHGPNKPNIAVGQALMHVYRWDGEAFAFSHAVQQPTDGAGQGVAWAGDEAWWVDRPQNLLIRAVLE